MYAAVFSEIILKGRNRSFFQEQLLKNVNLVTSGEIYGSWLLSKGPLDRLQKIPGIDYIYEIEELPLDLEILKERLLERNYNGTIKLEVKRDNKNFPKNSLEIAKEVGSYLSERGVSVDLKNPDQRIYVEILKDRIWVAFNRFKGPGGLPVGSSGKVLSLLSGGIDSPVASWLIMKRGCEVDYLHVHSTENIDKIKRTVEHLKQYHIRSSKLFAVPYDEFYKHSLNMPPKYELILFRRFIIKLANKLAEKHGAIITGDSLGQVASQTLENIAVTTEASTLPILRPLITYNKNEIIKLSKELGLYNLSIEKYKDCCSLVSQKRPNTRANLEKVLNLEKELNIDGVIERTLENVVIYDM